MTVIKNQLNAWINRINNTETIQPGIIAYNFGLFETPGGFSIYLIGAETFDENKDDWATNIDFEPKEKYLAFGSMEIKGKSWEDVLLLVTQLLKEYVQSADFRGSIFRDAVAVTTGFDDGDLVRII